MHENGDDFQMFFPSTTFRQRFLDLILEMTKDQEGMITGLELERSSDLPKVNNYYHLYHLSLIELIFFFYLGILKYYKKENDLSHAKQ